MHTTAGYLLWASFTHFYTFDHRAGDVFACVADIGWITGHSYVVYGPLCNGGTTLMFESLPTYPDAGRYWDLVQRHGVHSFYTAPTAIRALMKFGTEPIKKCSHLSIARPSPSHDPLLVRAVCPASLADGSTRVRYDLSCNHICNHI